jgi:hypothetical protein
MGHDLEPRAQYSPFVAPSTHFSVFTPRLPNVMNGIKTDSRYTQAPINDARLGQRIVCSVREQSPFTVVDKRRRLEMDLPFDDEVHNPVALQS